MQLKSTESVEKFRNELFNNLQEMYMPGVNMTPLACSMYKETEENSLNVTKLEKTLELTNSRFIKSNKKLTQDLYLTVEQEEITLWTNNIEFKCYNYLCHVDLRQAKNKTVAMMTIVKIIISYLN